MGNNETKQRLALVREQERVKTLLHELQIATDDLMRLQKQLADCVGRLVRINGFLGGSSVQITIAELDRVAAARVADKQSPLNKAIADIAGGV